MLHNSKVLTTLKTKVPPNMMVCQYGLMKKEKFEVVEEGVKKILTFYKIYFILKEEDFF